MKDGIAHCGRDADDWSFASAYGGKVFSINEHGFEFGSVLKARNAIFGEIRIEDASIFKLDGFE